MKRATLPSLLAAATLGLGVPLIAGPALAGDGALPKVVKKVAPDFPASAVRKGISSGVVRVHLEIDGAGKVTAVNVENSDPPRIFDESIASAVAQWQFEATGKASSGSVKIVLQSE